MEPLAVFVLAFLLWLSKDIYLRPVVARLSKWTNEHVAYWSVVSTFEVLLALFVTLICPSVYFIRWDFPVKAFLVLFTLSILSLLPAVGEFRHLLNPTTKEDREMIRLIKSSSLARLTFLQIISTVLPEELSFRYVFLGLLSLWNPFAGLIAISVFFGLSHKFSHPNRRWNFLLSNTLTGFVFGLAYLYTGSLLMVMVIHWLINMIPTLYVKYERAKKSIATGVALSLLSPLVFRDETASIAAYLRGMSSLSGLLWGLLIGSAMLGVIYAGIKTIKGRGRR